MRSLLAMALVLTACSGGASGSGHYQLGEFFISGSAALAAETESLTVENVGEFPHTLVVTTPDGRVLAATGPVFPEQAVSLHIDLAPGSYQFTCRIVGQGSEGQLLDHYERGMHTTISVRG